MAFTDYLAGGLETLGGLGMGAAGVATANPLLIAGGVSLGATGVGSLLQTAANDDTEKALKDAANNQNAAAQQELKMRQGILDKISTEWTNPQFDTSKFTPQEIKYMGDYMPQVSKFIQEQRPELITGLSSQLEKGYQQQALAQMAQEAQGKPVQVQDTIKQKMQLASMQAAQADQSQKRSMLQDMANRGMLGSGQEASLMMNSNQGQQQNLYQNALQAGITGAQEQQSAQERENARRQSAIQSLGSMASGARQQELGIESANVSAINAFNQRASSRLQQHLDNQADIQNQAALRNLNTKQEVESQNVAATNTAGMFNMNRSDKIAQALTDAKNRKLEAQAGAMGSIAGAQSQQGTTAYNQAAQAAGANSISVPGQILMNTPQMLNSTAQAYKAYDSIPNKKPIPGEEEI